jgi:hypothetical protein
MWISATPKGHSPLAIIGTALRLAVSFWHGLCGLAALIEEGKSYQDDCSNRSQEGENKINHARTRWATPNKLRKTPPNHRGDKV